MQAADILKIPDDKPELLFTPGMSVDDRFRSLIKRFHPDVSSDPLARQVTAKITVLVATARRVGLDPQAAAAAKVSGSNVLTLTGTDGKIRNIRYGARSPFELGSCYYGSRYVVYVVDPAYSSLYDSAVTTISTLHFASDRMATEVGRYTPKIKSTFTTVDGKRVLVLTKPEGVYTLRHVLDARGGSLEPEHAAWIMSSVLNMCCYLQWARLCHNDLSVDSVFVSPREHAVYILGGWWYAAGVGEHLTHLPARSARLAPVDIIGEKLADSRTDLILARALIREVSGNLSVADLMTGGTRIPAPMARFLSVPGPGLALEDYKVWTEDVLPSSFGARRFVELKINDSDILKET